MKTLLFFLLVSTLSDSIAQSIVGKWKTIDDETNKPKSIVEIYNKGGKVFGKIVKLFQDPDEDPDPICDECTDYRKNMKVIGMEIITDMVKDEDEWIEGEILDPENGKVYRCKLWVEDGELKVRGYIAFFFRTQSWLPYTRP